MMLDSRASYTRERRGAVSYTRGKATAPAAASSTFRGSQIQPLPGKVAAMLPEGERSSDYGQLLTKTELRPTDQHTGTPADYIVDSSSVRWKVMTQERYYGRGPVTHYKVTVRRQQETP